MRVEATVSEVIGPCLVGIDQRNARTLISVVGTAARIKRLSLTALGRGMRSKAKPKHSIKRVDRLLGNPGVHTAIDDIYGAVTKRVLGSTTHPILLIDWTDTECDGFVALSATLATALRGGRAIIIRSEVYPLRKLNNGRIQRRFLRRLREQLPEGVCPTVIVDAGFGVPFFRAVQRLGWDFVGRLTRQMYVGATDHGHLKRVDQSIFPIARNRPKSFGTCYVTARHKFLARVVVVKKVRRGRHGSPHRTRKGTHPGAPAFKQCQRRGNEPWVLVTSLANASARCIVDLYGLRMQIEQCFRDAKNQRFGLALQHVRSRNAHRIAVLFLIATLVCLVATTIGIAIEHANLHRGFQANTIKRRVLSRFVLGLAVLAAQQYLPPLRALRRAIAQLATEISSHLELNRAA